MSRANSKKQRRILRAVDLFAGCGGMSSGLQKAGFVVKAAVELDHEAAESYRANHPKAKVYQQDIREVDPADVLRHLELEPGELDLLAGCPPCQGFTRLTEKLKRRDPRNGLVRQYLRFVKVLQPRACLFENVPGLRTRGRHLFGELKRELRREGYKINEAVLELADFGVPQFRRRLLLLAGKDMEFDIPAATHANPVLLRRHDESKRPKTGTLPKHAWRTVRDALRSLPKPARRSDVSGGKSVRDRWHVTREISPDVRKRLEHAIKNKKGRDRLPKSLQLECHKRNPDGYHDVYGAIRWDEPSPTITSGCTNASKGRFGHPSRPRPLTAREAAILQTFPRRFKFKGANLDRVAAQIGNALPRRFAFVIGRSVARQLRGEPVPAR